MFCPRCGKQSAPDARFCAACGAAAVPTPTPYQQQRIVRPRNPRMIAGVCSGFAIHYGWDIALVRILFTVFTCLTSGIGIIVYIIAWVALPDAMYALPPVIAAYPPSVPSQHSN